MNHRWNNDTCIYCGIKRKKITTKKLMAIVNHPPWEAYMYERKYFFSFDGNNWSEVRQDCDFLSKVNFRKQPAGMRIVP